MVFLIRRAGPWGWVFVFVQAVLTTRRHWQSLPAADRGRLQELLRRSRGRPGNLTERERVELRYLARRMRPLRLLRALFVTAVRPARSARRGRR